MDKFLEATGNSDMRPQLYVGLLAFGSLILAGCASSTTQPNFPDLHPVKGVVKRAGQPVKGGVVTFTSVPQESAFMINSEVSSDGTYNLSTVRTTDTTGERKMGAPAGKYQVTYQPPLGDQTAGGQLEPIDLPDKVTIQTGENNIQLVLPRR